MRVLKDGADSVGTLGALNRVYLNIGLFSEEWLLHFRPFLGGQKISPIRIADAQRNSVYWQATEAQSIDMAIFFLVTARADRLADAPGGQALLDAQDTATVDRGAEVFARDLRRLPFEQAARARSRLRRRRWARARAAAPARAIAHAGTATGPGRSPTRSRTGWSTWSARPDFLDGNYLSTERRVPLDVIETNTCSAIATNGIAGDIWDNFTSSTYKSLPPPKRGHRPPPGLRRRQRLPVAGQRPRLHPARLARQPLVDGALPAQQLGRPRAAVLRPRLPRRRAVRAI